MSGHQRGVPRHVLRGGRVAGSRDPALWRRSVIIGCTNRGGHNWRRLCVMWDDGASWTWAAVPTHDARRFPVRLHHHAENSDSRLMLVTSVWSFSCPSCRRKPRLEIGRMNRILDAWWEENHAPGKSLKFDLSALE